MTTETKPLTDEMMRKILSIVYGKPVFIYKTGTTYRGQTCLFPDTDPTKEFEKPMEVEWFKDPRTNTDAADELLGWLCDRHDCDIANHDANYWELIFPISKHGTDFILCPISGEPKRLAICNLAATVLGVE